MNLLGSPDAAHPQEDRVLLDQAEGVVAGKLSRMTGKRRDEVLAESYRRADKILACRRK